MYMNVKLTDIEMLRILKAIHREFIATKMYFNESENSEELEGIVPPEEYKELYNSLLKQAHEQGELEFITTKIQ